MCNTRSIQAYGCIYVCICIFVYTLAPSVRALALDGEGTGAMIEEVLALLNTEGVSSAPTAGRALRDDGRYTCVCVCVCVRERERVCVRVCVCSWEK